ncbi:FlgO family outer membrane protein [Shewanella sp. KJ2020]|uniref:FlgO family outer membrane protein n=1 Tax=Shewanella sp. KJ2020 TaxID=2919172 RepID=UPI0020A7562C|nr:FlgO family outer membrane protein [Shewanella sp. KJ2020]MCP3130264.1 FlgO family outer membrane protein [Shewanella sp. KJ2020]
MLKQVIIPLTLLMLGGCVTQPVAPPKPSLVDGNGLPPTAMINHLSQRIVTELVKQNDALRSDQPIVVATPVLVGDMSSTNALAQQLQQGLMTSLHQFQFNVVDLNLGDGLRVTADGDFILTRDWQKLSSNLPVEHLLVSTMSLTTNGMAINARIVNVSNNRVVSTSQTFVTQKELGNYMQLSEQVISQDGILYRQASPGMNEVRVLGDGK